MPLARYFFYVGGVLLALLFVLDAYLPEVPVAHRADANLPAIRIHSDRKWPERIVFDTSQPTTIAPQIASGEASIPVPAEAFARMQPSDAKQLQSSSAKQRETKLQRKGRIARRQTVSPRLLAARQPQFGWFRNSMWWGG
jgi:hypothetical protein